MFRNLKEFSFQKKKKKKEFKFKIPNSSLKSKFIIFKIY